MWQSEIHVTKYKLHLFTGVQLLSNDAMHVASCIASFLHTINWKQQSDTVNTIIKISMIMRSAISATDPAPVWHSVVPAASHALLQEKQLVVCTGYVNYCPAQLYRWHTNQQVSNNKPDCHQSLKAVTMLLTSNSSINYEILHHLTQKQTLQTYEKRIVFQHHVIIS